MKLNFKKMDYQLRAVESVVDCFDGQPKIAGLKYRMDPGVSQGQRLDLVRGQPNIEYKDEFNDSFKNAAISLTEEQLLKNIQKVQERQNLPLSSALVKTKICPVNLDVEMETGTGKTYCYIKSIFELNERFGWSKFIIVVPSIAIREGVYKTLEMTADHFQRDYHKKAKFFIYNSRQLHHLESFSSDAGINIMVINVQAFNARGKDNRRIYDELDDFQSRRPIDVIKANNPILILDEPQKMEGKKTLSSLEEFNPLFMLYYSATLKTPHNKIHRLDALDAYNQKLVKKISVRGISVKGLSGTNAYLYLESIEISSKAPVAKLEFEIKMNSGIKRVLRNIKKGDNLYTISNDLDQYKNFVISEIDAINDTVEFTNGLKLDAGQATGDINEEALRRIQIREAIKAHFEKEKVLYYQGIKVLTLFFIDEVAKYRVYTDGVDTGGEYAKIFEEEYQIAVQEVLSDRSISKSYRKYLTDCSVEKTHRGYFSIDKKEHFVDAVKTAKSEKEESTDQSAYDLILKDKERLLSFAEPTRFIFSHSALREGWDNPNVFVICTLKHSNNMISRRQEVGRGLRIAVNQQGERQDNPATVHQTNVLTVVASESYIDFVKGLQADISESLSERPREANAPYFAGKLLQTPSGNIEVTADMAEGIEFYLIQNGYIDRKKHITEKYHEAVKTEMLSPLPEDLKPYSEPIHQLIASVFSGANLVEIDNDRNTKKNPLNTNFEKKEFKELWNRINHKAVYGVKFDSSELIEKCINTLNKELNVAPMQYTIQRGEQRNEISSDQMESGESFQVMETATKKDEVSIHSSVKYDLIGKIGESVQLTRKTIASILGELDETVFAQFKRNPENFISEAVRLINEQKATVIIEHLSYDSTSEKYGTDIFTEGQSKQDFKSAGEPLKHHIYDYVITDSKVERNFANELDTSSEVVVYAKLPNGFSIPTPVGDYNPDWAISFKEGTVKHIYFVAETKGSISSMELRGIEKTKIECARKFFAEISRKIEHDKVTYDVVNSYGKLMQIVGK